MSGSCLTWRQVSGFVSNIETRQLRIVTAQCLTWRQVSGFVSNMARASDEKVRINNIAATRLELKGMSLMSAEVFEELQEARLAFRQLSFSTTLLGRALNMTGYFFSGYSVYICVWIAFTYMYCGYIHVTAICMSCVHEMRMAAVYVAIAPTR